MNPNATSPWPFVGMGGMACAFFLYAASGSIAPWWGVVVMLLLWLVMFATACRWWTPHPARVPFVAGFAIAFWFAAMFGGAALFNWG